MTIENYDLATVLLAQIETLEEQLTAIQQSINVDAQARSMAEFVDLAQLQGDIETAIAAAIVARQNEFNAL